jgi:hypothetical protein
MIVCPLSYDECSRRINLRPKTVFLMAPSRSKRTDELQTVISRISSALRQMGLSPLDGSSLIDLGDTVCNICSTMQGCSMGIGFFNPQVPADALSNIFWEMGTLQGWGRPVLLVANKKADLPSDFTRDFCIFYETNRQYRRDFSELVQRIKEREQYYINVLAGEAIQTGDYEKAIKYYQEAFLISGKRPILTKMRKLKTDIGPRHMSTALKTRLTSLIDSFLRDASRSLGR